MTEMEICSVMLHPEKKQIITKNDHVQSIFKSVDLKGKSLGTQTSNTRPPNSAGG